MLFANKLSFGVFLQDFGEAGRLGRLDFHDVRVGHDAFLFEEFFDLISQLNEDFSGETSVIVSVPSERHKLYNVSRAHLTRDAVHQLLA